MVSLKDVILVILKIKRLENRMETYDIQLEKLKTGEIEKIEVNRENFFLFRNAWVNRADKKYFVGEAHHNGDITYRYDPTVL